MTRRRKASSTTCRAQAHGEASSHVLGNRAAAYAQDAADAVEDAHQGTMDALHEVQHTVANGAAFAERTLDVRQQIRQHPWLAIAAAVAAGFTCGRVLARR